MERTKAIYDQPLARALAAGTAIVGLMTMSGCAGEARTLNCNDVTTIETQPGDTVLDFETAIGGHDMNEKERTNIANEIKKLNRNILNINDIDAYEPIVLPDDCKFVKP